MRPCRSAQLPRRSEVARSFLAPEGAHVALARASAAGNISVPTVWISFAHVFATLAPAEPPHLDR